MFNSHWPWTRRFLASHSLIGVADSYGIELLHPRREGRSAEKIGRKGLSNQRWIVGGKLGFVVKAALWKRTELLFGATVPLLPVRDINHGDQ